MYVFVLFAAESVGEERQGELGLNMMNLTNVLKEVTDWETLGIRLGVEKAKIDEIAQRRNQDPHLCKVDLLAHWLNTDLSASWEKLAKALDEMDLQRVGQKIRASYCSSGGRPLLAIHIII